MLINGRAAHFCHPERSGDGKEGEAQSKDPVAIRQRLERVCPAVSSRRTFHGVLQLRAQSSAPLRMTEFKGSSLRQSLNA